jgi:sugar phosphate isomerase/epimerase
LKVSLHTSSLGNHDLNYVLSNVSRFGFRYVEIAADISITPHFSAHTAGPDDIATLDLLLSQNNLILSAIDIGGWDTEFCIANLGEEERIAAVERVSHVVGVAEKLRCEMVTSHLWGGPEEKTQDHAQVYAEQFIRSITELCPLLEKTGVRMAFMPHPGGLIEESDSAVDLIKSTTCKNIGYIFGTGHTSIMCRPEQNSTQMIAYADKSLTHVSVSDSHDTWRIVAPPEAKAHEHSAIGSGDVDFPEIFHALLQNGFNGFLSVHLISELDRIEQAAIQTRLELEKLIKAKLV